MEKFDIEMKPDIPFWKRKEIWKSPLAIFLIIGYVLFGISYALLWILKWIFLSPIRPFTDSEWFCDQGFHRYRFTRHVNGAWDKLYTCKICRKEKFVDNSD